MFEVSVLLIVLAVDVCLAIGAGWLALVAFRTRVMAWLVNKLWG
jgi:hypothetical protein